MFVFLLRCRVQCWGWQRETPSTTTAGTPRWILWMRTRACKSFISRVSAPNSSVDPSCFSSTLVSVYSLKWHSRVERVVVLNHRFVQQSPSNLRKIFESVFRQRKYPLMCTERLKTISTIQKNNTSHFISTPLEVLVALRVSMLTPSAGMLLTMTDASMQKMHCCWRLWKNLVMKA